MFRSTAGQHDPTSTDPSANGSRHNRNYIRDGVALLLAASALTACGDKDVSAQSTPTKPSTSSTAEVSPSASPVEKADVFGYQFKTLDKTTADSVNNNLSLESIRGLNDEQLRTQFSLSENDPSIDKENVEGSVADLTALRVASSLRIGADPSEALPYIDKPAHVYVEAMQKRAASSIAGITGEATDKYTGEDGIKRPFWNNNVLATSYAQELKTKGIEGINLEPYNLDIMIDNVSFTKNPDGTFDVSVKWQAKEKDLSEALNMIDTSTFKDFGLDGKEHTYSSNDPNIYTEVSTYHGMKVDANGNWVASGVSEKILKVDSPVPLD